MKYALIENGMVMQTQPTPGEGFVEVPADVVAGMVQAGEAYVAPPPPPPPPPTVPDRVTMRQARLALHAAGKLAMVEAALDALPEPPKTAARIEWDHSQEVHRNRQFVQMLGQGLGLSSQQLDELFILAATL